jgi:hypothetical protein
MKKLIVLLLLTGCRKFNYSPVQSKAICKDFEGVWYCANANIDSLVIKFSYSKNDTSYYTSNHPEFIIKHECPYKWKGDNLYFSYNGFTYEFRH